jgi:hypothetical protein
MTICPCYSARLLIHGTELQFLLAASYLASLAFKLQRFKCQMSMFQHFDVSTYQFL